MRRAKLEGRRIGRAPLQIDRERRFMTDGAESLEPIGKGSQNLKS